MSVTRHADAGGIFRVETRLWLPADRQGVFALHADAFRLEEVTPPWLHFHVVTPGPIEMQAGTRIEYRLRLHGLPVRWTTEIAVWDPPREFVDIQLRGPYRLWRHQHRFEECEGGTLVCDEVRYKLPLAGVTQPLFVRRDLERIFTFRQESMRRLFSPGAEKPPAS